VNSDTYVLGEPVSISIGVHKRLVPILTAKFPTNRFLGKSEVTSSNPVFPLNFIRARKTSVEHRRLVEEALLSCYTGKLEAFSPSTR
jgi:hypothetical protein